MRMNLFVHLRDMYQITHATKIGYANEFFQNFSKFPKVNLEKFTKLTMTFSTSVTSNIH